MSCTLEADALVRPSGTFAALRVRNYRLHSLANLVSITGTWMQVVAQNWMVLELTGSTTALGASVGIQALPTVALSLWGGVLADRVDRRRLLMWIHLGHALLALALVVLAVGGLHSVAPLLLISFLSGSLSAIEAPASGSFATELVPRGLLGNAIALGSAISSAGRVAGMALAGVLVASFGAAPVFALNAASYVVAIAGLAALRVDELEPAPRVPRAPGQLREGIAYVLRDRRLVVLFVLAWFLSGFGRNFQVTMAAMTAGPLGTGASGYGQASMVFAVGAFVGAFAAARAGASTRKVLVLASLAAAVGQGLAGMAPNMGTFLAALAPAAVGAVVIDTAVSSLAQLGSHEAIRGRVLAVLGLVGTSATAFGGPALGWVGDRLGARASLVVGAAVAATATLAAVRVWRSESGAQAVEPANSRRPARPARSATTSATATALTNARPTSPATEVATLPDSPLMA